MDIDQAVFADEATQVTGDRLGLSNAATCSTVSPASALTSPALPQATPPTTSPAPRRNGGGGGYRRSSAGRPSSGKVLRNETALQPFPAAFAFFGDGVAAAPCVGCRVFRR